SIERGDQFLPGRHVPVGEALHLVGVVGLLGLLGPLCFRRRFFGRLLHLHLHVGLTGGLLGLGAPAPRPPPAAPPRTPGPLLRRRLLILRGRRLLLGGRGLFRSHRLSGR